MKRVLLLLALAPALAQAGPWAKILGDKDSIILLDKASVRKVDNGRKAWTLQSYRTPQTGPDGKQYLSLKAQHLYSCDDKTRTQLEQLYYAEVLGKGEPVGTYKYESFDPEQIETGTQAEAALKAVCRAKRKGGHG